VNGAAIILSACATRACLYPHHRVANPGYGDADRTKNILSDGHQRPLTSIPVPCCCNQPIVLEAEMARLRRCRVTGLAHREPAGLSVIVPCCSMVNFDDYMRFRKGPTNKTTRPDLPPHYPRKNSPTQSREQLRLSVIIPRRSITRFDDYLHSQTGPTSRTCSNFPTHFILTIISQSLYS
jgi:hypothetical protein